MSPSRRTESEDLAKQLRSLYQIYDCESELPNHDDLVAKLNSVKQNVRETIRIEFDRDYVYPLSYNEALGFVEKTFGQKLNFCFLLTCIGGIGYAGYKFHEQKKEPTTFLLKLYALYGGIKYLPFSVKKVFLEPKEKEAKELMEEHNQNAKQYFNSFKKNLESFILNP